MTFKQLRRAITWLSICLTLMLSSPLAFSCEFTQQDPMLCEQDPSSCRLFRELEQAQCDLNKQRAKISEGFEIGAFKHYRLHGSVQAQAALDESEKQWQAYLKAQCWAVYEALSGGNDREHAKTECEIKLIRERTAQLSKLWVPQYDANHCDFDQLAKVRQTFLSYYKQHKFVEALEVLQQPYERCESSPYRLNRKGDFDKLNAYYWYVSDLMLVRRRVGDLSGCVALGDEIYAVWGYDAYEHFSHSLDKALRANYQTCRNEMTAQDNEKYPYAPKPCRIEGFNDYWALPQQWHKTGFKDRENKDEIFHELACIRYQRASKSLIDRDGPKQKSEGLNTLPYFDLLYVRKADEDEKLHYENTQLYWLKNAKMHRKESEDLQVWGGYCFELSADQIRFGRQVGELWMDINSSPCRPNNSGTRMILNAKIHFPLGVVIDQQQIRAWR